MADDDSKDYSKIRDKLISAFNEALKTGDWESTLFFRALGKRLRELRDYISTELGDEEKPATESDHYDLNKEGYIPVYISIYQADGGNLEKWRNVIKSLSEYTISRPVYREEEHIKALIRSKTEQRREGYVVVLVRESDILPPYAGKPLKDRFGHELLNLKEGSVKLANIMQFVHENKSYKFKEGELIR